MTKKKVVRKPILPQARISYLKKHCGEITPAEFDKLPRDAQREIKAEMVKYARKYFAKIFDKYPVEDHPRVAAALRKAAGI